MRDMILLLCLGALTFSADSACTPNNCEIQLGVYGPITSISTTFYATAAAFDIDFRKNFNASLINRFGPPIVAVPNLNPNLRIRLQIGTSNSEGEIGVSTCLNMFLGRNGMTEIAGLVGGYHSAISMPVASLAGSLKVPQISFGSTSPALSNKGEYPYFLRTIPPDSIQGAGMWQFIVHFKIPSLSFMYALDAYGVGLFQTVSNLASEASEGFRVTGIGIKYMPKDYDIQEAYNGIATAKSAGSKFIFLAMTTDQATPFGKAAEDEGLFGKGWQLVGSEAVKIGAGGIRPTLDSFPAGFIRFNPISQGPLFSKFKPLWLNMTADDVMGAEAMTRYSVDKFLIPLSNGTAPIPTDAMFDSMDAFKLEDPFVFDAAYSFVFAINDLLNNGYEPESIKGKALLDKIYSVDFEGITGRISFNADGDRLASYTIDNLQPASGRRLSGGATQLVTVASFSSASSTITSLPGQSMLWMDGSSQWTLPNALIACLPGYEEEEITRMCRACPAGSISLGGAGANCTRCGKGFAANAATAATQCDECVSGTYTDAIGESQCKSCPTGEYADQNMMTSCKRCGLGTYTDRTGRSECDGCGGSLTTQYIGAKNLTDCACGAGSYRTSADSTQCLTCLVGVTCDFGADSSTFGIVGNTSSASFTLKAGFWSSISDPLKVYECKPSTDCPGGLPETCMPGRTGIACGVCMEDTQFTEDGCEDCKSGHIFGAVLGVALLLAFPILLYPGVNAIHRWKLHPREALLITCEVIAELMQVCAAVTLMDVEWPDVSPDMIKFMAVFQIELADIIPLPCIIPMNDNVSRYLVSVMVIPMLVIVTLLCYPLCSTVLYGRMFPKWDLAGTFNLCGKILNILFISQVMLGMMPLQCYRHPTKDQSSIREYAATLCGSSDHHVMLVFGLISLLGCTAGLVYLVWEMQRAPRKLSDIENRKTYMRRITFMVEDFKLSRYWWNIMAKMQELLLGLVILFDPNNTRIQLALFMIIFILSAILWTRHWPYKLPFVNFMSIMTFCCLILMLLLGTNKLPVSNSEEDSFTERVFAFVIFLAFITLFVGLVLVMGNLMAAGKEGELWAVLHMQNIPPVEVLVGHWDFIRSLTKEEMQWIVESWEHHERLFLLRVLVQLQMPGVGSEGDDAMRKADSHYNGGGRVSELLSERASQGKSSQSSLFEDKKSSDNIAKPSFMPLDDRAPPVFVELIAAGTKTKPDHEDRSDQGSLCSETAV